MPDPVRVLDLFCGAGGATRGYQRAGWQVVGNDHIVQPNYCGSDFILGDALQLVRQLLRGHNIQGWLLSDFDLIHASPPCQRFSLGAIWRGTSQDHPDLIAKTRDLLQNTGLPYVIENVPRAPLTASLMLCGTMFGLHIIRHRIFEIWPPTFWLTPPCAHNGTVKAGDYVTVAGHGGDGSNAGPVWAEAMGIDWMTKDELAEAIPPAYTEWLGRRIAEADRA